MEIDISLIQDKTDHTAEKMIKTFLGSSAEELVATLPAVQLVKMIQHSIVYTLGQIEEDRMERASAMAAGLTHSQGGKK